MERLAPDFKDFSSLLNSHRVSDLLIRRYAVGLHGYHRYTGDIDVWIELSRENAARTPAALRAFGFRSADLTAELFLDEGRMTRLGREPVKIQILNAVSGVEYADARPRAVVMEIDEPDVPVISLADLRANKAASGRLKDLADLDNLPEVTGAS